MGLKAQTANHKLPFCQTPVVFAAGHVKSYVHKKYLEVVSKKKLIIGNYNSFAALQTLGCSFVVNFTWKCVKMFIQNS